MPGRVLFIKDGEVFHQIYRGGKNSEELYQNIADTLTVIATGGEKAMSILFYMRLAAQNIRKNSRTYVPYILTCIGSVMVFNILLSLSLNTDLDDIYGGSNMRMILCLGCITLLYLQGCFCFTLTVSLSNGEKQKSACLIYWGWKKSILAGLCFLRQ